MIAQKQAKRKDQIQSGLTLKKIPMAFRAMNTQNTYIDKCTSKGLTVGKLIVPQWTKKFN
jgi:hypothetical protein